MSRSTHRAARRGVLQRTGAAGTTPVTGDQVPPVRREVNR